MRAVFFDARGPLALSPARMARGAARSTSAWARIAGLTAALVAGIWAASPCAAQAGPRATAASVEGAMALYLEADFAAAELAVREVIAAPRSDAPTLARAHALLAVLRALDDGDDPEVERALRTALALDLDVPVPEGAPRVLRERFEDVRRARREEPFVLEIDVTGAGHDRVAELRVLRAPTSLGLQTRLVCTDEGGAAREDETRVALSQAAFRCEAQASTDRGQIVRRAARELAAESSGASVDATPWIILGVVAGVVVIGGAVALGVALSEPGATSLGAPRVIEW